MPDSPYATPDQALTRQEFHAARDAPLATKAATNGSATPPSAPPAPLARRCAHCDAPLAGAHHNARYCGEACSQEAERQRTRERRASTAPRPAAKPKPKAKAKPAPAPALSTTAPAIGTPLRSALAAITDTFGQPTAVELEADGVRLSLRLR